MSNHSSFEVGVPAAADGDDYGRGAAHAQLSR